MMKPKALRSGSKIAIVSLSCGGLGDEQLIHKYHIAKNRLEEFYDFKVVLMPHALMGSAFLSANPRLRAKDLMDAFLDESVSGIFCAIGGDDAMSLLPYIDFDVIGQNPKVFMGYSDTTINHFMMYKAGLVSFYGPSIMAELEECVKIFEYTQAAIDNILFTDSNGYYIPSSAQWCDDFVKWDEKNIEIVKTLDDARGYDLLQGTQKVTGHLLGGCIDVFTMAIGTPLWPTLDEWKGAILFFETREDKPSPTHIMYILRSLAEQGILNAINGIIVGKPWGEVFYDEYKAVIKQVVCQEQGLCDLPIFYNANIGHGSPSGILPIGIKAKLDCKNKTIQLLESATI